MSGWSALAKRYMNEDDNMVEELELHLNKGFIQIIRPNYHLQD